MIGSLTVAVPAPTRFPINKSRRHMRRSIYKGFEWDAKGEEYTFLCSACSTDLYAPTLTEIRDAQFRHTRSSRCLGGY